jgi:acetyltransferase-like isoleucine patch superfamily enzyme
MHDAGLRRFRQGLMARYQELRILKYRLFSDCPNIQGKPVINQPVQFLGPGTVRFRGTVNLGFCPSPGFFSGYLHIEARTVDSVIDIGDGVWVNNNSVFVSSGPGIFVGDRTTFGPDCIVTDSDFHDMHPDRRMDGNPKTGRVAIGRNVFIGADVRILKGVEIGDNSVVGLGSVLTRSFPENVYIFGNPARVVQRLETT